MSHVRLTSPHTHPIHWVPWAMIDMTTAHFTKTYGLDFERERDDLDEYWVLYFSVNGHETALKRYKREPQKGITIYVGSDVNGEVANQIVSAILERYELTEKALSWRESVPFPTV